MKITSQKSLAALLLCSILFLSACGSKPQPTDIPSEKEPEAASHFYINTLEAPGVQSGLPNLVDLVGEKKEINSDTVGWLQVPGTHIDDVVLWYPGDVNAYYYRLGFDKKYSFNGVFYADYRNTFGSGKREELSNNTVIYGHTISEDINGVKFAPLKHYAQEEFARENPYVYFSTADEDMAWEVFAVFYATVDLPYNRPDLGPTEFGNIISECVKRSIYTYDTQVSATDKVLTLSTCTYTVPGKGSVGYPNPYRYVVMAKLVDKGTATKTEATFELNPSPKEP